MNAAVPPPPSHDSSREPLERQVDEKDLLASEERYRLLIEQVQDYAIFMLDKHGRVVTWNAGAALIKGYSAEEIIGQHFSRFYPEEDVAQGIPDKVLASAASTGRHEAEGWLVRKDGSQFRANVVFTALRDATGGLYGFSEVSRDVSERFAVEAKYRGLLEAAPDAMVVVNQKGDIVLLNLQAEKVFGYHVDELLGQPVTNIIPEGFAERLVAGGDSPEDPAVQRMGTGIELRGRRRDGSEFPIEIMLSPLESPEGLLVTAAIRDITTRKDAERHLVEVEAQTRRAAEAFATELAEQSSQFEKEFVAMREERDAACRRIRELEQRLT